MGQKEKKESDLIEELNHLTLIIERGKGKDEYIYLDGDWFTAEEYLEIMGYQYNAWVEV